MRTPTGTLTLRGEQVDLAPELTKASLGNERPASAYLAESSTSMATYILYGSKAFPGEARGILEELIALHFEDRASDYQNGAYFRAGNKAGENFELKRNIDPFDGAPAEITFPEFPTLLYINATLRSEELRKIMGSVHGSFVLLRHEYF